MTPTEHAAVAEAIAALEMIATINRSRDQLREIARASLASLRAVAPAPAEETGEADPFRNADPQDWKWLYENLGDGGRGKFWKAVFDEFHHIRLGRLARIASGEEEKS